MSKTKLTVVVFSVFFAGLLFLIGWLFMTLWNFSVVAALDNANPIGYWQAFWLAVFMSCFLGTSRFSSS